jgi:hypothetical protein
LGGLRAAVRRSYMDVVRATVETQDGRRVLIDALRGLTAVGEPVDTSLPYEGLGGQSEARPGPRPVFVTGRFRSGSTLIWNLFRQVKQCRAYYEPLNERQWFNPTLRGTRVDATHRGVVDYWQEYEGLEHLGRWYREEWTRRRLYMRATDSDAGLQAYIQAMIDAAPQTAVLQFNRVDFRLPWLRATFPSARVLHIYRHPRDQWCSTLVDPGRYPATASMSEFPAHDHYYLLSWADDLSAWYPFLDPRAASHPYELFYYLWRLSHAVGCRHADASFSLEALGRDPRVEVARLMREAGIIDSDLNTLCGLVEPQPSRWPDYASASWFSQLESRCERTLAAFAASTEWSHAAGARSRA